MGQTLGAKGRSRRRTKRPAQNRLRVVVTYLLLISIVFSNISNPLFNVFAGQKTEKEEFRIYADELQRAAEEAFDDDEPLEEALEIDSKDKTLLKNYQKLFEADGRLYEIFPEYETVNEIDGITLRTFIRIAEDADPKSYMLTGEEELIFLYVNDGDASVSCRVNIDGYISAYCTVKPYESVFGDNEETIVSGSGVTAGTGSGSGSGSGQTAEEAPVKDETAAAEDTKETEAPADTADEENSQKEENEAADKAEEAPAGDDKADETGDKDDAEAPADDSRDEESENTGDEVDASENIGDSDTADGSDSSDDTADEADGSDDGGDTADEGGSSDNGDTSDDAGSSDSDSSVEIGMSINVRHLLATSIQAEEEEEEEEEEEAEETEEKEPEETEAETEESTEAETEESTEAETEESTEAETEESTEAAEAEAEEGSADAETKETTAGTVPETAVMADTPYVVKIVDEEEEDAFERVGSLDGKTYNIVALEQYKTARAFVIDFSESGLDKETLESTGHFITYTVDPTGSAELVHTAKLVRDGAEVAFGIIPQEGYKIAEVTSNGDELAIIDIADVERTATASEATRSEAVEDATRSEALREDAIYYEIPEVLEDQEVMILLEEIVPGSHPAFHQAKTVNGVTVSVSAEEGILPEGTELSVEEVTEQVAEAVKENVEANGETSVTDVLAYDINLMLDGKKLSNSYWEGNYVNVQFSGDRIEEVSKTSNRIDIAPLETPTEVVEAALGETEQIAVVDEVSVHDIHLITEERKTFDVSGTTVIDRVDIDATHFTIWAVVGTDRIEGEYTLSVGNELALISNLDEDHIWESHSWQSSDTACVIISSSSDTSATVKATGVGTATITHIYSYRTFNGSQRNKDTFTIHVINTDKVTITFDPNGGMGEIQTIEVEFNEDINAYSFTTPYVNDLGFSKDNCVFVGWSYTKTGDADSSTKTIDNPGNYIENVQVNTSISRTYYAIWMEADPSGDGKTAYFYVRTDNNEPFEPGGYGNGYYFPRIYARSNFPNNPNYDHFRALEGKIYYEININNNLANVEANIKTAPEDSLIQSESEYANSRDSNVQIYNPGDQEIEWYVIKKVNDGEVDNHKFGESWHVDGIIRDKHKYAVTYYPNGGNENVPPKSWYSSGTDVSVSFEQKPSRNGYEFLGWDRNPNAVTPEYPVDGSYNFIMPAEDVNLYAIWKSNVFTVSGTKIWVDSGNEYGYRPESVSLELKKTVGSSNSVVVSDVTPVWSVVNENTWKWEYKDLPQYEYDTVQEKDVEIAYTVTENNVPVRYEVSYNGYDITNTLKTGSFEIVKELEGIDTPTESTPNAKFGDVKFKLYKLSGLESWDYTDDDAVTEEISVSVTTGKLEFNGLVDGRYVIVETTAPDGYLKSDEIHLEVSFNENTGSYTYKVNGNDFSGENYTVLNRKLFELPVTGGSGLAQFERIGWMLITVSVAAAGFNFQRSCKRRRDD